MWFWVDFSQTHIEQVYKKEMLQKLLNFRKTDSLYA